MCFGFQRSSAKGGTENGTDVDVPARKISNPVSIDKAEGKPVEKAKAKKKGWRDDEYGDSVR